MPEPVTVTEALTALIRHLRPTPDQLAEAIHDAVEYDRGFSAAEAYCEEVAQHLAPDLIKGGDDE